jgi:hypothetical protein
MLSEAHIFAEVTPNETRAVIYKPTAVRYEEFAAQRIFKISTKLMVCRFQ